MVPRDAVSRNGPTGGLPLVRRDDSSIHRKFVLIPHWRTSEDVYIGRGGVRARPMGTEESMRTLRAYQGARVYLPSASVDSAERMRRTGYLGGRTWSVDPRGHGTCESLPGGR